MSEIALAEPPTARRERVTLTDAQWAATKAIRDWFLSADKKVKPVFRVFGYAGVGKTTMVEQAIEELGLAPHVCGTPGVIYAAFTGKAALVMTRKGTPAQTIHSLIYRVSEASDEEVKATTKALHEAQDSLAAAGGDPAMQMACSSQIELLKMRLMDMRKPRFSLNEESVLRDAKLLVLDEVSMVGPDMGRDLLKFGVPILVLGDPGQLPPIRGEGFFTECKPDVMLTEVLRQALDSAVIRLATMARQGAIIPHGTYDEFVTKMSFRDIRPEHMLNADQVICGKNATRIMLNGGMKRAAGFGDSVYPTGKGEKIICLKNRNDLGIVNGMFLDLINPQDSNETAFTAAMRTEDGDDVSLTLESGRSVDRFGIYKGHYLDHVEMDKDRNDKDYKLKRNLIETTWGWAITCHKAQGSQWKNIIVYDDGLGRTREDRCRWLYTGITRAESGLLLLD
jgi:exodeoxyribonuclease-5